MHSNMWHTNVFICTVIPVSQLKFYILKGVSPLGTQRVFESYGVVNNTATLQSNYISVRTQDTLIFLVKYFRILPSNRLQPLPPAFFQKHRNLHVIPFRATKLTCIKCRTSAKNGRKRNSGFLQALYRYSLGRSDENAKKLKNTYVDR
jgi:hypothetical protein